MISQPSSPQFMITRSDLLSCAAITEARFADPLKEVDRVQTTRRLLGAAFALEQALRIQSRCALVNQCGTHGTSNLADASIALCDALSTYADLVREIATRYDCSADSITPTSRRPVLEVA